ncbi:unnamed protein product [Rodentolepis nana]|uniref:Carrier domain-containing protein n=1 Tax=Rodentolepis nana TaxID=102285 RepID=A0A158QJ23_RODNA|nr:unnamed protein product [Rodentolepis nana]
MHHTSMQPPSTHHTSTAQRSTTTQWSPAHIAVDHQLISSHLSSTQLNTSNYTRKAAPMVGVKKQSESANSSVSLSASQQAGAFFPRQFQSGYDSSTRLALNFTPSLFRMTASNSSSSLSEMASDSSTSSRRSSAWKMKWRQRGSEMSRAQVDEVVRLVLSSFAAKMPHSSKLKNNAQLSTDFGLDSLDRVNLLKTLEKSFNFRVFPDEFDNLEEELATPDDIPRHKLLISIHQHDCKQKWAQSREFSQTIPLILSDELGSEPAQRNDFTAHVAVDHQLISSHLSSTQLNTSNYTRKAAPMVGVKKQSESANSSVSLSASQQAGAFFLS